MNFGLVTQSIHDSTHGLRLCLCSGMLAAMIRIAWLAIVPAVFLLVSAGCQTAPKSSTDWKETLSRALPVLGHRNWIIIADSAYPAQISPGVQTIYTGASQLEVVESVLAGLDGSKHVRPVIHLDVELDSVPETLAPGMQNYREQLGRMMKNRRVSRQPHEQLISKLDEAGKTFRVLILKSDLTIPYTSVFIELDCGYWGPEAEKQLRTAMSKSGQ